MLIEQSMRLYMPYMKICMQTFVCSAYVSSFYLMTNEDDENSFANGIDSCASMVLNAIAEESYTM